MVEIRDQSKHLRDAETAGAVSTVYGHQVIVNCTGLQVTGLMAMIKVVSDMML